MSSSGSRQDDGTSGIKDLFSTAAGGQSAAGGRGPSPPTPSVGGVRPAGVSSDRPGAPALSRTSPAPSGVGWGRGPIPVDTRRFKYDMLRARSTKPLAFSASKVDRMDPSEAGDVLHRIHEMFGIDKAEEARLLAFDKALFFEHAINGASLMQPGRGSLNVDGMEFDIQPIKTLLGVDQRRFFRAFADNVAEVNQEVLQGYDVYDPVSVEKVGQLHQLAAERGLQKFPYLVHDSSDACTSLTYDERIGLMASKRVVLESTFNQADAMIANRTQGSAGRGGGSGGTN